MQIRYTTPQIKFARPDGHTREIFSRQGKDAKAVVARLTRFVESFTIACIEELTRAEHELPAELRPALMNMDIRLTLCPHRSRSWGGRKMGRTYMSLSLFTYALDDRLRTFREYKHIAADPTIGDIQDATWDTRLRALIAHEVSHAAQHSLLRIAALSASLHRFGDYQRGHGVGWQRLYAILRRSLVNRSPKPIAVEPPPCENSTTTKEAQGEVKINSTAIRRRLRDLGKTQTGMGEAIGIDKAQTSRMLSGQRKVQIDEVERLARYLDISTVEMLRLLGVEV